MIGVFTGFALLFASAELGGEAGPTGALDGGQKAIVQADACSQSCAAAFLVTRGKEKCCLPFGDEPFTCPKGLTLEVKSSDYLTDGKYSAACRTPTKKRRGPYRAWYADFSRASVGELSDPPKSNVWKTWFANGNPKAQYQETEEVRDGLARYWHENGQLFYSAKFKKGVPQETVRFFTASGELMHSVVISKGSGEWRSFYRTGKKAWQGQIRRGKRDGEWLQFWPNGTKRSKVRYQHGKKEGAYRTWDRDGEVETTATYVAGKLHGRHQWVMLTRHFSSKTVMRYKHGKAHGPIKTYGAGIVWRGQRRWKLRITGQWRDGKKYGVWKNRENQTKTCYEDDKEIDCGKAAIGVRKSWKKRVAAAHKTCKRLQAWLSKEKTKIQRLRRAGRRNAAQKARRALIQEARKTKDPALNEMAKELREIMAEMRRFGASRQEIAKLARTTKEACRRQRF